MQHVHARRAATASEHIGDVMKMRAIAIRFALIAAASGGIIAACRNDVPAPTLPVPSPEVSPVGPKPKPIDPSEQPRKAKPKRVADIPPDANASDVMVLPENPDADVTVVTDSGTPLN